MQSSEAHTTLPATVAMRALGVPKNGELVLLHGHAEKTFDHGRGELIERNVASMILDGPADRDVTDDVTPRQNAPLQQMESGMELTAHRRNASAFQVELLPSPPESKNPVSVADMIRDIGMQKTAGDVQAQMESRYRDLMEAAPDAMVVVDQSGEIVLLNLQAEKQFGYRRDELLGQKIANIIPVGFAERLIADDLRSSEDALTQEIGAGIELIAKRKDGSEFPIEIMLSPLQNEDKILVTTAIRNISGRKAAEAHLLQKVEELNRSNIELGQFAYIASHDLQEPLRMVASYTQLLSRRYKGKLDADADEFIAFAVDGATRMQRLIQDLLTYSRIGTKGRELRDTCSETALKTATANLRSAIEESEAVITSDPIPNVLADETQLVQLFQNLLGNAIKYQDGKIPVIHVGAARIGKNVVFSVRDNGIGIDPQYSERIFGMFQRLHKREAFTGTGIGLAICKKIVERHGGYITVESQLGGGSVFCFQMKYSGTQ